MTINFTIGLNVLEFLCHFGAMICYFLAGSVPEKEKDDIYLISVFFIFIGVTLTTIGANLWALEIFKILKY